MKILKGGEIGSDTAHKGLRMRWKRQALVVAVAAASVSFVVPGFGDAIEKTNDSGSLNLTSSWVTGVVPTATDTAVFDSVISGPISPALGANLSVNEIQLTNPGGNVTIASDGKVLTIGNGATSNAGGTGFGIDMSAATADLTINDAITNTVSQIWNVASGHTLTANGVVTASGVTVQKEGAGTVSFSNSNAVGTLDIRNGTVVLDGSTGTTTPFSSILMNGGTINVNSGNQTVGLLTLRTGANFLNVANGATFTFSNVTRSGIGGTANAGYIQFSTTGTIFLSNQAGKAILLDTASTNNAYATFGTDNWAATDGFGQVIGAAVTAFTSNIGAATITGTGDVEASFTQNGGTVSGLRFSNPTTSFVLTLSSGSTFTINGLLMASGTASNTITGGNLRPTRSSTSGAFEQIIQNSTVGDLTIASIIPNASSGAPVTIVKNGIGRVLLTNTGNGNTGNTVINAGILAIAANGSLGSGTATTTINGGTLEALNNMGLAAGRTVSLGSHNGTVQVDSTFSMGIAGVVANAQGAVPSSLTKTGTGNLLLGGVNTYTGGTTVTAGGLQVSGGGSVIGNVTFASGTTVAGAGTISGNVTVGSNSFLTPGDAKLATDGVTAGAGVGSLTVGGTVTLGANVIFNYEPGDNVTAAAFNITDAKVGMNLFSVNSPQQFFGNSTSDVLTVTGANGLSSAYMNSLLTHFKSSTFTASPPASDPGSILNAQVLSTGFSYAFFVAGNSIDLKITSPSIVSRWVGTGHWLAGTGVNTDTAETNWQYISSSSVSTTHVPQQAFDTATFDGSGTSTVAVDGANIQVGELLFNTGGVSYNIAAGTGSLTMNAFGVDAIILDSAGSHTISTQLNLASNLTTTTTTGNTMNFTGNIVSHANVNTPVQSLTFKGTGTSVLTGTNTYLNTTISGGTLQIGASGTTGNLGSGAVVDNGVLVFKHSDNVTLSTAVSGTGIVVQSGTGTLILGAVNTFTGGLTTSGGTIQLGVSNAAGAGLITDNGTVDMFGFSHTLGGITGTGVVTNTSATATTLTISQNANRTFSGFIAQPSGAITLVKVGTGELDLGFSQNFNTGGTFINAGALAIHSTNSITGTINLNTTGGSVGQLHLANGLSIANNLILNAGANDPIDILNTQDDNGNPTAAAATLTGSITAAGTTAYQIGVANDLGTLTLAGASVANNNIANLSQGVLNFATGSSLTDTGGTIRMGTNSYSIVNVAAGATLTSTIATGDALVIGTGGAGDVNNHFGNVLTINGNVNLGGATLNLQGTTYDNLNTGFADTQVFLNAGGVLTLGTMRQQNGTNSAMSYFYFNGGTLDFGVTGTSVASGSSGLSAGGLLHASFRDQAGGAIVSVDGTNSNTFNQLLVSDGLTQDGGFTKIGTGTLTLAQANTFTGATFVNNGLLILGGSSPLGMSNRSLTVAGGAELDLNAHGGLGFDALLGNGIITQINTFATAMTETIGLGNSNGTFGGAILNGGGNISLVHLGTGTQTFTGTSNQFAKLTVNSGAVKAGASGTFDNLTGHIVVNSNSGLQIADTVIVNAIVDTNVTGEFVDVPAGNGTLQGPVNRLTGNYVAGISGSGSLTLANAQNLNGLTTLSIDRGNVIYSGNAVLSGSAASMTVGTLTSATSMGIGGNANITLGSLTLGQATGSQASAIALNMTGGQLNLGTSLLNLYAGTNTATTVTTNLSGGTITFGGFQRTGAASAVSPIGLNGTLLRATASNTSFLGGNNGSIGTGGAKIDTQGFATTIGTTLTGVASDGGLNKQGSAVLTLQGNATYTGATTVAVGGVAFAAGTSSIGQVNGAGTFTVNGATVTSKGITATSLAVSSGKLTISANTGTVPDVTKASKVTNLSVTGGTLDISNNALIHEEGTPANLLTDFGTDRAAVVAGLIKSTNTNVNTVTAVGLASDVPALTTFGGVSVDANSIILTRALIGDADLNGTVNFTDFQILQSHFNASGNAARFTDGDFNQDGSVNFTDFQLLQSHFNNTLTLPLLPGVLAGTAAVPEPASLALLGFGSLLLMRRRRETR